MGTVKYTGPVASFHCPTNAEIRSLKVHFSPKQEGSGDPSPENVRPIVGWDGVKTLENNKNLFDTSKLSCSHPSNTWNASTETNDMIFSNGELSGIVQEGWRDTTVFSQNTPFQPGTYTLSFDYINGIKNYKWKPAIISDTYSGWYTSYKGNITIDNDSGHKEITFTADKPFYVALNLNSFDYATTTARNKLYNIQLELGSIATPYEPCKISTINYEFGVLGKNKFDKSQCIDGARLMKTDGSNYTTDSANYYISPFIPVVSGATYTKNSPIIDAYHRFATYTSNDISSFVRVLDNSNTIIIEPNETYIRFCGLITEKDTAQLELGSTATTYEPYDPNKTVYGGWVDLITGEVCEEKTCITIDGTQTIQVREAYTNANAFRISKTQLPIVPIGYSEKDLSSFFQIALATDIVADQRKPWSFYINGGNQSIFFLFPKSYTSVTDVQNFFVEHPTQISYMIAPNTYYLAPTELQTFLGHNNVWSNADYVEVEYDLHETQSILARKQFIVANQPHIEEASGSIATFNTDISAPLKECKIYFNPIQEGSGDASPENVRAINGWNRIRYANLTDLNIAYVRDDLSNTQGINYICNTTFYPHNIKIIGTADANFSTPFMRCDNAIKNTTYYIYNLPNLDYNAWLCGIGTSRSQVLADPNVFTAMGVNGYPIVASSSGQLRIYFQALQGKTYNLDFYPIISQIAPIEINWQSIAGTIYGGYVDLVKGEIVQEWYTISIDETASMRIYTPDARNQGTYCEASYWLSTFNAPNAASYEPYSTDGYCNILPYIENNYTNEARATAYNSIASIYLSGVKTQEEYLAWIAEHGPVIICYRLATPIHYTLTPTTLKTLRGQNNIWSDSNGNIEIKYWKH